MPDRICRSLRDIAGNAFSLKRTTDHHRLVEGLGIFPRDPALGQTSGYSDIRLETAGPTERDASLASAELNGHFVIAGVMPVVLQRTREARCIGNAKIKLMAGGGTQFPFDPLDSWQYTVNEITTAVEAAESKGNRHPISHQGNITAHYKEYSDVLSMFRQKALAPAKYRENARLTFIFREPTIFAGLFRRRGKTFT